MSASDNMEISVSIENTGSLGRKMTVAVPAERVEQEIDQRLKNVGRKAKIKGFRPGKVPLSVIRQKFGGQVRQEVLGEIMQSSYSEAISREKLNPAGAPQIAADSLDKGQDLRYTATFEVYPQIELSGLFDLKVEKPLGEITDADLNAMIENLRRQKAAWEPVTRTADDGDRVTVDFEATIGGKPFDGGQGRNVPVVLGSGQMLADFEAGLKGIATDEKRSVKVKFPKDYSSDEVAGKKSVFEVTACSVEGLKLPELDEAFIRDFGVDDGRVESLKRELKQNMTREMEQTARRQVKQQVLDGLLRSNSLDVPQSLVDDEIAVMMNEAKQNLPESEQASLSRDIFAESAQRRVALGLLIAEIVRSQNIELDRNQVKNKVEQLAQGQQNAEEISQAYLADPRFRSQIESMVLEEQVVDWLVSQAEVTEKQTTFGALMNFGPNADDSK